jgi:hypothetical protein
MSKLRVKNDGLDDIPGMGNWDQHKSLLTE